MSKLKMSVKREKMAPRRLMTRITCRATDGVRLGLDLVHSEGRTMLEWPDIHVNGCMCDLS